MSDRYFVEQPISLGRVVLAGAEAHHLIHVMRATPGTRVVLFDGGGAEFTALVERVRRSDVELSVLSREPVDRELPVAVTLGVALPKGERQKWLVEKAVELGVARIVPLRTQRAVAQPGEQTLVRLRRTVIEASKQCGRNRLLEIDQPRDWPVFVEDASGAKCRLLAQQEKRDKQEEGDKSSFQDLSLVPTVLRGNVPSTTLGVAVADAERRKERVPTQSVGTRNEIGLIPFSLPVLLAIGPEGGLTDEEVALAVAAGWQTVDLGPRVLRVETAALLLAAMVAQCLAR